MFLFLHNKVKVMGQLNICAFKCQHLFGTLFLSIFCSCADYALFWCIKYSANLASFFILNVSENGSIWDEFSEQH